MDRVPLIFDRSKFFLNDLYWIHIKSTIRYTEPNTKSCDDILNLLFKICHKYYIKLRISAVLCCEPNERLNFHSLCDSKVSSLQIKEYGLNCENNISFCRRESSTDPSLTRLSCMVDDLWRAHKHLVNGFGHPLQ